MDSARDMEGSWLSSLRKVSIVLHTVSYTSSGLRFAR